MTELFPFYRYFRLCIYKMSKMESPDSMYCPDNAGIAAESIFACHRWIAHPRLLLLEVGVGISLARTGSSREHALRAGHLNFGGTFTRGYF